MLFIRFITLTFQMFGGIQYLRHELMRFRKQEVALRIFRYTGAVKSRFVVGLEACLGKWLSSGAPTASVTFWNRTRSTSP